MTAAKAGACRRCGAATLTVRDGDTGLKHHLDPTPFAGPVGPDSDLWERHPVGWHAPAFVVRRGHPLHAQHQCDTTNQRINEKDSHSGDRP